MSGWVFRDKEDGSFVMRDPVKNARLYLPLCNNRIKSYVTPELKGDILLGYDQYLTIPKSTEDLHHCKDGRNLWLRIEGKDVWSCAGVSAENAVKAAKGEDNEPVCIRAGIGWFSLIRESKSYHIRSEMTVFVPSGDDPVEIVRAAVENTGPAEMEIAAYYAVPLYGRSTANLRDHRDVSTLCNRLVPNPHGVVLHPIMIHNETNSYRNPTRYFVAGNEDTGDPAIGGWGRMYDFIGENGSLEAPQAVYRDYPPQRFEDMDLTGEEAVGAVTFAPVILKPGQKKSYVIIQGITEKADEIGRMCRKYGKTHKADAALDETKKYWQAYTDQVKFGFADTGLNQFLKWVNFQPFLRKVFGSSYLPDFGYGTGKRYWRELWQDLLAIIIADPYGTKADILNNYNGVKLDGSNATLVGDAPGEFAHRSGLGRTWSDHGVWPYFTTRLYIDLTGDTGILLTKAPYFKDHITRRGRGTDPHWAPSDGLRQKTTGGEEYSGTILEHLLIQNLTSFYNVGVHNLTLLEAGDWDDTMDMARENGETVQFTAFYAANLMGICECLGKLKEQGHDSVEVLEEMWILFDTLSAPIDYTDYGQKQGRLQAYYDRLDEGVSGRCVTIAIESLITDLRAKAEQAIALVKTQEYITVDGHSFYNAYYTDTCERLGGRNKAGGVNVSLTPQAYLMVLGLAGEERAREIHQSVNTYLRNEFGGYILRSDHRDPGLIEIMGRGFGLAYGTRENGGQYDHMAIKYMNGLYASGLAREGYEVFSDIVRLCMDAETSRIFPGIPASIDSKSARGSYNYLTGSGSWLIFTLITMMFGIEPRFGDLIIRPRLAREQFAETEEIAVSFIYLQKKITLSVKNVERLDWGAYCIGDVLFNGAKLDERFYRGQCHSIRIPGQWYRDNAKEENRIEIAFIPDKEGERA